MQETQVWSLGGEDPLEKGMAAHSSILAWRISQTENLGGLQSMESQRVRHDWATTQSITCDFTPLCAFVLIPRLFWFFLASSEHMCLSKLQELVLDREAWHAAVQGSQRVRHDWATELNWSELNWMHSWHLFVTAVCVPVTHRYKYTHLQTQFLKWLWWGRGHFLGKNLLDLVKII